MDIEKGRTENDEEEPTENGQEGDDEEDKAQLHFHGDRIDLGRAALDDTKYELK